MELFIARHGEDEDTAVGRLNGTHDALLTERGKEQARALAQKLNESTLCFDHVFSSPLQRAWETALTLHRVGEQPTPTVLEDLRERDVGVLTGKTIPEAESLYSGETLTATGRVFFLHPQGGETFDELFHRTNALLETLKETVGDQRVCLVTHRGIATMFYASWYGVSWKDALSVFTIKPAELFHFTKEAPPKKLFFA